MLFVCSRSAYRGEPLTFVYVVTDTRNQQRQQLLQLHSVRFGDGGELRNLTKMRRGMSTEWMTASDITAVDCFSSSNNLADEQRHRPVVGNFTKYTFDVADTYEVIDQSINQSINLFVQMQNKHWTGHQGRMQPPLTGAHKNNVSKSNKRQYFTEKKI